MERHQRLSARHECRDGRGQIDKRASSKIKDLVEESGPICRRPAPARQEDHTRIGRVKLIEIVARKNRLAGIVQAERKPGRTVRPMSNSLIPIIAPSVLISGKNDAIHFDRFGAGF